ncbi:PREDICTED: blue-sensitive opsin-like [Corvus brachyrhynchos]|uniref:blue-sensitive opsin-like n=1 Tax=Corvus brachyrhynchos TaxID=85066 RepID=UPI000816582C|nr:PREDICTED: blue-sensitive opsin-like [Corvus brachyrhynchos]
MQKLREMRDELPEDFYIPMTLETSNLTALSPFLVPQTHLGSPGIFTAMTAFMFMLIVLGMPINALTIVCTAKYKKLRSHLNYILVNLAVANLLVICVGSTTAFYSFYNRYLPPYVPPPPALSPLSPQVAKQQEQSATTQKAEREVTKMVVVMVLGFLVCWAPYSIFALWVVTHRGQHFDVGLASIPSVFSKASTVYNPVIYVFMNKQFRSCMLKLVFCGRSPFGDDEDVSGSSQATQVSSVSSSQVSPA